MYIENYKNFIAESNDLNKKYALFDKIYKEAKKSKNFKRVALTNPKYYSKWDYNKVIIINSKLMGRGKWKLDEQLFEIGIENGNVALYDVKTKQLNYIESVGDFIDISKSNIEETTIEDIIDILEDYGFSHTVDLRKSTADGIQKGELITFYRNVNEWVMYVYDESDAKLIFRALKDVDVINVISNYNKNKRQVKILHSIREY